MAELNTKFHCKKDGVTEDISAYTTLDEVQNTGIEITIGGIDGYIKYGAADNENASQLNCKVGGSNYRVHKTAIPPITVTLLCYDVETEQQISAIKHPLPDDRTLYLNNENAPSVAGYDFVMMDGVKYTNVAEDDIFYVWYIAQSIPDRTKTSWSRYFPAATTEVLANTYSATNLRTLCYNCTSLNKVHRLNTSNVTDMRRMFYYCSSLTSVPEMDTGNVTNMGGRFYSCSSLTSVPEMDTSNVTVMGSMFYNCTLLTSVPEMDTSNVTDMQYMFYYCSSLTSVDWEIDMSSCGICDSMFTGCPATNIRLKNVPNGLRLSSIGTTNYTVVNYI